MRIIINTAGTINSFDAETTYKMIKDAGFDGVDWNIVQCKSGWVAADVRKGIFKPTIFDYSVDDLYNYLKPEYDIIMKNGLEIAQAHAQFPPYCANHPEFLEANIERYKRLILVMQKFGIKILIIHGASLNPGDTTQTYESIKEINFHLFESLIPTLVNTDVKVCLENLPETYEGRRVAGTCSEASEALMYVNRFNEKAGKDCFGFCFDTGHYNLMGRNPRLYLDQIGSILTTLHIHDNYGTEDDHRMPYTGTIIWKNFIDGLKDINYQGDISFETQRQVSVKRGIDPEVIPILLKAEYEIGKVFVKRLGH